MNQHPDISEQRLLPFADDRSSCNPRLASVDTRTKLLCLLVYIVALFQAQSFLSLGLCTAFALGTTVASHVTFAEMRASFAPLAFILAVTLVAQIFYCQTGEVLFYVIDLPIRLDALLTAGYMVVRLLCLMAVSVAFMHCTTTQSLIETLSWMLSPLQKVGIRGDAFIIALDVALSTLPLLIEQFRILSQNAEKNAAKPDKHLAARMRSKLGAYRRVLIGLLRDSFRRVDGIAEAFAQHGGITTGAPCTEGNDRFSLNDAVALMLSTALFACALLI